MPDIQAVAALEWLGTLTVVFPSVSGGHELVFCGRSANSHDLAIIKHQCLLCRAYGAKECPYIKKALSLYMVYCGTRFGRFKVIAKRAAIHQRMRSVPLSHLSE